MGLFLTVLCDTSWIVLVIQGNVRQRQVHVQVICLLRGNSKFSTPQEAIEGQAAGSPEQSVVVIIWVVSENYFDAAHDLNRDW